jgi:hypothetical protein
VQIRVPEQTVGGGVDDTARAPIAVRAIFATLSRQRQPPRIVWSLSETRPVTWQAGTRRPDPGLASGDLIPRRPGGRRAWPVDAPGLVTLSATVVALAIRLYLLTRLRYLTGSPSTTTGSTLAARSR